LKFRLDQIFFFLFFLIFIAIFIALYNQYTFSKKIVTQNFINKYNLYTLKIEERFKAILNKVQFYFKIKEDENIKKLYTLELLYKSPNFSATNAAKILNKDFDKYGHYEVFIIDKNYKVIDASYKPDIGFDLGAFKVYKYILNQVFTGKKRIDISYPHIDSSSMTVKKYYLIRSPDGKYLLQLAYVIDIYSMMKKLYQKLIKDVPNLEDLKIFFVEKYLIHEIDFNKKYGVKIPLKEDLKKSKQILKIIIKDISKNPIQINENYHNVSKIIEKVFKDTNKGIKLDEQNKKLIIYKMIDSIFSSANDKLILKTTYRIDELLYNYKVLLNRFLYILLLIILAIFLMYKFIIIRITKEINLIIENVNKNKPLEFKTYIKEIEEFKNIYNKYRIKLNEEIEKNKILLNENKRFIVDTIHQIKTPLSVITLNIDFIKNQVKDKEIIETLEEIEAAVTMLTNSYEDLSYLSGNGIVKYEACCEINIAEILKERLHFFNSLAKANNKIIISDIDEDIYFKINKIELERIIDNNLSNAVKYSTKNKIFVRLKKVDNKAILRFESFGNPIKDKKGVFNKNYREHSHKRGLGIGLNIVKDICEKYNIEYSVLYEDGKNVFEYVFKI